MSSPVVSRASIGLPPGPGARRIRDVVEWVWRPIDFLERNRRLYGESFTVCALPSRPPIVWLGEPDAVRDVFAAGDDTVRAGEAKGYSRAVVGRHSLLVLDGEEHRRQRRLMSPAFHGDRVRAHAEIMRAAAARAVDRWAEGSEVRLLDAMQAIALDVMLRAVFGVENDATHARLSGLLRALMHRGSSSVLFGLAALLGGSRVAAAASAASRSLRLGPLRILPDAVIPGRHIVRLLSEVDALIYAELAARRAASRPEPGRDVLSLLMAARDESGSALGDVELRDELMTLLLAGHETTAITMAWALHHLMAAPAVLARLRAELASVARDGDWGRALTALPYLDAVVNETMRLTPVVPLVGRVVQRAASFGRYRIPAGMMVAPSIWLVHHRDDLYPEPGRFRPERFLERTPAPHELFPFGGGLRRCVGAAFATLEVKIVLAEVVSRVALSPAGPSVKPVRRGISFAPSGGVRVRVQTR